MHVDEIRKTVDLEDRHWWFAERRYLLRKELSSLAPGRCLDVGAAGGGNTRVLKQAGWSAVAVEYDSVGAQLARYRDIEAVQADACHLPFAGGTIDLVVAFDVLEHIDDDIAAVTEIFRTLRPGGTLLVAVPCDMKLWSPHDVACGHHRRYDRPSLQSLLNRVGFDIESLNSWNVILRPLIRLRRMSNEGSDTSETGRFVNAVCGAAVRAERRLPLKNLPGVTLIARARRPS